MPYLWRNECCGGVVLNKALTKAKIAQMRKSAKEDLAILKLLAKGCKHYQRSVDVIALTDHIKSLERRTKA